MSKKMFSISVESEYILDSIDGYSSTSAYVNESITNNCFPCYSRTLRTAALYLLDVLCSADINVKGKTLAYLDKKEVFRIVDDILEQSLLWLKDKTISIPSPIKSIMEQYLPPTNEENKTTILSESSSFIEMKEKIENNLNIIISNPISGVTAILDNWDLFFDDPSTYEYLAMIIKIEKKYNPIDPKKVFKILRDMETLVIMQFIKN